MSRHIDGSPCLLNDRFTRVDGIKPVYTHTAHLTNFDSSTLYSKLFLSVEQMDQNIACLFIYKTQTKFTKNLVGIITFILEIMNIVLHCQLQGRLHSPSRGVRVNASHPRDSF